MKRTSLNQSAPTQSRPSPDALEDRRRAVASPSAPGEATVSFERARKKGEGGYTLVALLALMTILALAMTAAAPNLQQQKQRQLEEDAIERGEEVAEAIRLYIRAKNALPTSIAQLLEGVPVGTKKVQILRPWAARDPLSESGEWRLIKPTDAAIIEFQRSVMLYAGGRPVQTRDPHPLFRSFDARVTSLTNLGSQGSPSSSTSDEDDSSSSTGPFIGVASRSRREAVMTYYGIERIDKWVFTPLFK